MPEHAVDEGIDPLVEFVLTMDRLKEVERENPTLNGSRRERTAEHSWHVALGVIMLHRFAAEPVDLTRAVMLAVIHDLPEAQVGDTFAYGPDESTRRDREREGLTKLIANIPCAEAARVDDAWHDFEFGATAEARFVRAIDSVLPMLLNRHNPEHSSWVRHDLSAEVIRRRIELVRPSAPALAALVERAIDDSVTRGLLRR